MIHEHVVAQQLVRRGRMELEAFGTVAKLQRREEHVTLVRAGIVGRRLLGGTVSGVELTIGKTFLARKLIVGDEVGRESRGGTKHEAQTCACLIAVVGTLACDALNVPADTITKMNEQCEKINLLLGMLNAGQDTSALFPMAKEAALTMLEILSKTPPFSYMDIPKHRERIERVFTADNALKYVEFAIKAVTNSLPFEEVPKYADAVMLQRYTAVCGHLAYSLEEYQKAMLDFAEQSDGNEADRTAEGFAKMFGTYFPPEFSITEGNAWMSTLNNSVQYISVIRPGEKVAKLVKRMHYVSFVGMFRSDLFEGLCVGHAPKKCKICGKWFLTTNARHTKYCGGYAPGDKLHRTCRQIGNLKGREQRELADDHPIIQIYEKRLNTINRYVKRGTLDADLAEVMKKLAKDKELRAKSDVAYAKGAYEKEMEQAALLAEAKIHI